MAYVMQQYTFRWLDSGNIKACTQLACTIVRAILCAVMRLQLGCVIHGAAVLATSVLL